MYNSKLTPADTNTTSTTSYVTYTSSTGVKTDNAKFISNINIDSTGKLTYNVARLTYATGAVGGVETKGLVSIDTTSTKGVSATTKLGLSINNGVLKFTKIIDPIITKANLIDEFYVLDVYGKSKGSGSYEC